MSLPELDNLVRAGLLKAEAPDPREFDGLIKSGLARLRDAANESLAFESRFDLAYNAAHALSLAALRWQGYRPDRQRFVVFQALAHTLKLAPDAVRILDKAHSRRNIAEYEGGLDVDVRLLAELLSAAKMVQNAVERLGPVKPKPGISG
jgi:hypothetical protein